MRAAHKATRTTDRVAWQLLCNSESRQKRSPVLDAKGSGDFLFDLGHAEHTLWGHQRVIEGQVIGMWGAGSTGSGKANAIIAIDHGI